MPDKSELSALEHLKAASNYLRGTIAEELRNDNEAFENDTNQLLKHHGMYQQDDRDHRTLKGPDGKKLPRDYSVMVRLKVPGGRMTSQQFLHHVDLADELGNGTMRFTTRQTIQLHAVLKRNVRAAIRRIRDVGLTTLGACGDVSRNVMCCPAPHRQDSVHDEMQQMADRLSQRFSPRTGAYQEIWLTDPESVAKVLVDGSEETEPVEPLYGKTYLPRKFKVGIALVDDNCIDVFANDLGLIAIREEGHIVGYQLLVGGGMGVTPSRRDTFPALGQPMAFLAPDQVGDVIEAIVRVQRDLGNRKDRKRARMKYLIFDWGLEKFRAKVEEYYGQPLTDPRSVEVSQTHDHLGWEDQGDGRWCFGLNVENGRVLDREGWTLKTALREICNTYQPGIRLTSSQSILLTDIQPEDRSGLEAIVRRHGVKLLDELSTVRRWSDACVALPTCGLAISESERVLPDLIDRLEVELDKLGLADEVFTVRMTGCSNGCARPYNADVGLVGKTVGKYTLFLGGGLLGNRLAFLYKDLIRLDDIVPTLLPLLAHFKQDRQAGETFGDFCHRKGAEDLATLGE